MKSDLEIAREAELRPIGHVARDLGLLDEEIEPYGRYKAKIALTALRRTTGRPPGKYVLVTAVTPTPLGEGKTLTTLGLSMALHRRGFRAAATIRQPSMGPVFGVKGGAAGGGRSQVVPMEDLNLHLTGDFHAVAAANNLLAAYVDTSLLLKNPYSLDPFSIRVRRVVDINDRALRRIVIGCGGRRNGLPRETGFDIVAASEIMAILGLSKGYGDMRRRLGRILVGRDGERRDVKAEDLHAAGAMAVLLRDALKPNLMQTTEGTPVLIHTGPFANIAHGNSSILADEVVLPRVDFLITEAGFGADMGAEKFFNIKCRVSGRRPNAVVVVATTRALKAHGAEIHLRPGQDLDPVLVEANPELLDRGMPNLAKMIEIVHRHGLPVVVAVNRFQGDTDQELDLLLRRARDAGAFRAVVSDVHARGGAGGVELADAVAAAVEQRSSFEHLYPLSIPIRDKIEILAREIYGAQRVKFYDEAERRMRSLQERGYGDLPVCMAKTQYSLSHDPHLKNRPEGYVFTVRDVNVAAGAGFVVPMAGDIMLMPGLPARPALCGMDLTEEGEVTGLF